MALTLEFQYTLTTSLALTSLICVVHLAKLNLLASHTHQVSPLDK